MVTENFPSLVESIAGAVAAAGSVDVDTFRRGALQRFRNEEEIEHEIHRSSAQVAAEFDGEGPNLSCLTACAAAAQAIVESVELIRVGDADVMIADGAQSMIHPLGMTGFCR